MAPGITRAQIFIFFFVICTASISERFVGLLQPLFLTQQLHIPTAHQGELTGLLESAKQTAILLLIGVAGALADRIGRRTVLMIAVLGFGLCFLVYPFVAAVWALFIIRFIWGGAFACWTAGAATKMMDYPDNASRGKFISLMFVVQIGFGAIFLAFVGSKLLGWFKAWGFDADETVRYGFWSMAAIALSGALVAYLFLQRDAVVPEGGRKPGFVAGFKALFGSIGEVFAHARTNPRFALTLLIGLVIRTDTVVIYAFLTLWVVSAARQAGIDAVAATATAGTLLAILSAAQFITPPIFGYLADRFNRVGLLLFALLLTTIAFLSFGLVHDVFGTMMIVAVVLVGLAEGAQIIAAQSLFGQEAPDHIRGAATGVFTFLGNISVLIINVLGGYLFDKVDFRAPFLMEGVLHLVFFILAVVIAGYQVRQARSPSAA
ncbi:MFS transporter [Sphingomonas immobilis]|uniref:MFS transporter n=1 Tax=Sphingomonas immobilis TaxID=3063997 RepID=A0ABT9A0Q3_9SPHN|nr:MFS transporter [Sphingomonas sp. CA1-15]MDO7843400.1 MFS transporter [Sphingomonas sp. CA1-15]